MALRALKRAAGRQVVKERLLKYANDCLIDKIPSCKAHKNACLRFIKDIGRSETEKDYPYYWDDNWADEIIVWFTYLYHRTGELKGQPIHLTDSQQFDICQIYGWRQKKNGRRRFKKFYVQEGRKNGKTQLLAGLAIFEISVVASRNNELCEVYCAATKRQQAHVLFDEIPYMLSDKSPIKNKFRITNNLILHPKTKSFIRALSKDDGRSGGDGSNVHCLILDERHQMVDNSFANLFYGAGSTEPLLCSITTAGVDLSFPCYQEYEYVKSLLDPNIDIFDDTYLADIYELDREDYADFRSLVDEKVWIKANPVRATYEEGIEYIRGEYKTALNQPDKMNDFLTKVFDVWVQDKASGYMNMQKWKACEVKEFPFPLRGKRCVFGVDISTKIDFSSVSIMIPFPDENKLDIEGMPVRKYACLEHSFVPNRKKLIERVNSDRQPYDIWEQQGYITVTNTEIVDQLAIMQWCFDFAEQHGLIIDCWAVDKWNAAMFMQILSEKDQTVYDVSQNYGGMNDATVEFRENVYEGNIIYTPDPLFNLMMSNAVVKKNSQGAIIIDKEKAKQRIDVVDATLCAFKLARTMDQNAMSQKEFEKSIDDWLASDW